VKMKNWGGAIDDGKIRAVIGGSSDVARSFVEFYTTGRIGAH